MTIPLRHLLLQVLLFAVVHVNQSVMAQNHGYVFEKNTLDQDLIYDQIEDILIDRDGFTWLATPTGLYKFDGYTYTTYIHNLDEPSSISENYVTTIFEDSRGLIWIGTYNNGLNVYNKEFDSFYNYRNELNNSASISSNKIPRARNIIAEDENRFIWITTDNGLDRIDPETREVVRHLEDYSGHIIYHENQIWIAGKQLVKYDPNAQSHSVFEIPGDNIETKSLLLGSNGLLWLGTNEGLLIFNKVTNDFKTIWQVYQRDKFRFEWSTRPISSIYEDFKGSIWVAVGKSVYVVNGTTGEWAELTYQQGVINGILDDVVRNIYGDGSGNILLTYSSREVTKINVNVNNFRQITNIGQKSGTVSQGTVRSIFIDSQDNLWVGTYNHGLVKIPKNNNGEIITYQYELNNDNSLNSNYITAIHIDQNQRLWVGTFENGFNYADNIYNQKELHFKSSDFEDKLEIHEFTEDKAGRIWISTDKGFFIFDKENDQLNQYGNIGGQQELLKAINIQAVVYESPNRFWLATWNSGIIKLEINGDSTLSDGNGIDRVTIFNNNKDQFGNSLDNRFINIYKDKTGIYWLSSSVDGLIKMQIEEGEPQFFKYGESLGAPSNTVYATAEDDKGNIWISTRKGIGKFDPKNEQFQNYFETDGILSNSLIWDSYYKAKNGEIFFGGVNGITAFHPDSLIESDPIRRAYLSSLTINHTDINMYDSINGRVLLDRSIRYSRSINLTHQEAIVSFEFAALNITDPDEIVFAYQLEGFDEDWIVTGSNNRIATYTNLKRGYYTFKVKATKNLAQWGDEFASIQIIVFPPWWKTWWAFTIYCLVFLLLLYLFQRELVNRSQLRHKLEMEKVMHERDNDLNKEKFRFFTTLSHELRTPLTLILGPLDRMIRKNEANNRIQKNLLLIQNQARRLQKLTNQLMSFRKYEIENLKLKVAEGNVALFLDEINVAFRQHARMKQVHFHFYYEDEKINLFYDRDKVEIIVVNLLSNAFKFTPQEGTVNLRLLQTTVEHAVDLMKFEDEFPKACYGEFPENAKRLIQIEVSDTGVGIKAGQLPHVFERYFQASNIQSISVGGTGIGLEIAKNYVELHHGCIMVKSKEGVGTTFYVWLPMGRSHLSDVDIVPDFKPSEHKDHYKDSAKAIRKKYKDLLSDEEKLELKGNIPTILIVDDNPDIIFFLKENFEKSFNVLTANNGKVALQKAIEQMPDIIISDIMMPEMDGLEFCRLIKGEFTTSHIPVVLLTARTSDIFQAEGLETGADDYITKPFDESILNLRIKNLLESRKKLRERYSKEVSLMPKDITITQPDEQFLDRVIAIIEENITNNNLKVEWIAREIGMSHSVLYKKVMALTDLTVVEFVRTIRLKKASVLLSKTNTSIAQVSHDVGFTDPKYFSKCFQNLFGVTPSSFKKENA